MVWYTYTLYIQPISNAYTVWQCKYNVYTMYIQCVYIVHTMCFLTNLWVHENQHLCVSPRKNHKRITTYCLSVSACFCSFFPSETQNVTPCTAFSSRRVPCDSSYLGFEVEIAFQVGKRSFQNLDSCFTPSSGHILRNRKLAIKRPDLAGIGWELVRIEFWTVFYRLKLILMAKICQL